MDVVGVVAAYLPVVRVFAALSREALCVLHCLEEHSSIDYVLINGHDRTITVILAKRCIKLPDDGSLVLRNMLEQF